MNQLPFEKQSQAVMTSIDTTTLSGVNTLATAPQHVGLSNSPATAALEVYVATKGVYVPPRRNVKVTTGNSTIETMLKTAEHLSSSANDVSSDKEAELLTRLDRCSRDSVLISPSSSGPSLLESVLEQRKQEEAVTALNMVELVNATSPVEARGAFPVIEWNSDEHDDQIEDDFWAHSAGEVAPKSASRRRGRSDTDDNESDSSDDDSYCSSRSGSRKRGRRGEATLQRSKTSQTCLVALANGSASSEEENPFHFVMPRQTIPNDEESVIIDAGAGPATRALALQLSNPSASRIHHESQLKSAIVRHISWGQFVPMDDDDARKSPMLVQQNFFPCFNED